MKLFCLKLFDFIILLISILITIGFTMLTMQGDGQSILKISAVDNEYIYQLDEDQELEIEGPIGSTHVHISGGEAYISESPCENQLCVMMGSISKPGQWAACMPNRVFISIEGGSDDQEIDVLSY